MSVKADIRLQLFCGCIQHHKTVTTARRAASATGCCTRSGFIELSSRVEAGGQCLLKVAIGLLICASGCRISIPGLPCGVGAELHDFAIHQLQCRTAARLGEELLAREQLVTFEDLALETVDRNGEDLANDAFDDGDDTAHGVAPLVLRTGSVTHADNVGWASK